VEDTRENWLEAEVGGKYKGKMTEAESWWKT
jgi:hypothetical protein